MAEITLSIDEASETKLVWRLVLLLTERKLFHWLIYLKRLLCF